MPPTWAWETWAPGPLLPDSVWLSHPLFCLSLHLPIDNSGELEEVILKAQCLLGPQGSQWVWMETMSPQGELWPHQKGAPGALLSRVQEW